MRLVETDHAKFMIVLHARWVFLSAQLQKSPHNSLQLRENCTNVVGSRIRTLNQ